MKTFSITMSDYYKYCFIPTCSNTSSRDARTIFICVPENSEIRKKWCEAVDYPMHKQLPKISHCCEDHFTLENDLENYRYWKMFGGKMRLKPGVLPRLDRSKKSHISLKTTCAERRVLGELQTSNPLSVAEGNLESEPMTKRLRIDEENISELPSSSSDTVFHMEIIETPRKSDFCIQTNIRSPKVIKRSTATQCSPVKRRPILSKTNNDERLNKSDNHRTIGETDKNSSFASSQSEVTKIDSDTSFRISDYEITSKTDSGGSEELKMTIMKENMVQITKAFVQDNPRLFLGINRESMSIISTIQSKTNSHVESIYIVLEKIRTDHSYAELAYRYSRSESQISKIFNMNITKIAEVLKNLIVWPSPISIYRALPLQFRHRWALVQSIIDCFEIQIEKPSDAVSQSLTWSEYKTCNTAKYLVSITPAGLINFVSKGYGGRASDIAIVEKSGYLDMVPEGAEVLADRGFKNIDGRLAARKCKLACPPSVNKDAPQMSKADVLLTKKIASVRVHVERVIERLRNYKMLKAHACTHHSMLYHLDNIVIIAAALVNLDSPIFE